MKEISNILNTLKTAIDKLIIIIFCSYSQMKAGMLYVNIKGVHFKNLQSNDYLCRHVNTQWSVHEHACKTGIDKIIIFVKVYPLK